MPNISYSIKTKRLAVGARSGNPPLPPPSFSLSMLPLLSNPILLTIGQVGIYDLKQSRVQMLNAHSHSVTVLLFSDDGKLLATYAYGDSKVIVWQVSFIIMQPTLCSKYPLILLNWNEVATVVPEMLSLGYLSLPKFLN